VLDNQIKSAFFPRAKHFKNPMLKSVKNWQI